MEKFVDLYFCSNWRIDKIEEKVESDDVSIFQLPMVTLIYFRSARNF